jgi:hypothetical protein
VTPLFVSFHTGGRYEQHANELAETLSRFDLPYEINHLPCSGRWVANCSMKSRFILDKMEQWPDRSIVWVDADARVRQRPSMLLGMRATVDFACHYLDRVELLSGTLYFGGTVASVELARDWHKRCADDPNVWDQKHLGTAVNAMPELNVVYLPEGYTRIFDRQKPLAAGDVYIEHLQASRDASNR